jgi:hypothetical protein
MLPERHAFLLRTKTLLKSENEGKHSRVFITMHLVRIYLVWDNDEEGGNENMRLEHSIQHPKPIL